MKVYYTAAAIVFSLLLLVVANLFVDLPDFSTPDIVSFDTHKFVNAQRVMNNKLMGGDSTNLWKISAKTKQISNDAKRLIREYAGNAKVISKAAVVLDDNIIDITDIVLEELGLPTDVPDVNSTMPDIDRDNYFSAKDLPQSNNPQTNSIESNLNLLP